MTDIIDVDGGDVKRRALREIKYFANSLKGMMALADDLEDVANLEKEANTLRAEVDDLRGQRALLTALQGEISAAKSELGKITAEIDSVKAKFRG